MRQQLKSWKCVLSSLAIAAMMLWQGAAGNHLQAASPSIQTTPDILVNTTSDAMDLYAPQQLGDLPGPDGVVSLREAITAANNSPGPQVIGFNIPEADPGFHDTVFTIKPLGRLPDLTDDGTTIDGATQALFTGNTNPLGPEIVLDGSEAGFTGGVFIGSDSDVIRGLVIHSFQRNGIQLDAPTSNVQIAGCYLGTDPTGSWALGNGQHGIFEKSGGLNNLFGGPDPEDGNLIAGNKATNLLVEGQNTLVQRNFIGTDRTGTYALLGQDMGVGLRGSYCTIRQNLISGAGASGVNILESAVGNRIEENLIGTDITGTNPLPNHGVGVDVLFSATDSVIAGNVIAFNASDGVMVGSDSRRNRISRNSIHSNGYSNPFGSHLGIDLGTGANPEFHGDGVTPNDAGDGDAGPNNLQNYPILTSAGVTPLKLVVQGTIDSPNPASIVIEFFANPVPNPGADPSGYGEGAVYLGFVRPDSAGAFTALLPTVGAGTLISATATDADGNTSEFARNIEATIMPSAQLTALGPASVWLGLKNSDDVGTKFDLLAEVGKNGVLIGSGQLNGVPGGSSGFNNAVLRTINLALPSPVNVSAGDTLSIKLSVRIAVGVTGHRSGTARLWFNDAAANSRFGATIDGTPNDYFLLNGFAFGTATGPGPKKTIDVFVDRAVGGNPFKPFGTWSKTF
jgi:hypothetical protein